MVVDDGAAIVGVDTGGTFTDVFTSAGTVLKVPSTPRNPTLAIMEGLRAVGLEPRSVVAHGTTIATNAVLERKGARTGLITTAGFEDVLEIRRQNRPAIYDLEARWPDPLVPRGLRIGARERLDFEGRVLEPLHEDELHAALEGLRAAEVESLAICLLFSYANPEHERRVSRVAQAVLGSDSFLSLSHELAPHYGEYERTSTTVLNAYVMPVMRSYLQRIRKELEAVSIRQFHVMQSNGGLAGADTLSSRPVQTVLSGPAAGVVGARSLAGAAGYSQILTFDMGGTSTDVAVVPGRILEGEEGEIGSFPLLIPMLTIETVGAGGGSIARVDAGGALHVGPESAGADPGPAAYGRSDRPTVTDANLVLGRLSPAGLLGGSLPLDVDRAKTAVSRVAAALDLSNEQASWAILQVAISNMQRAVRRVTLQRGYDPRRFILVAFGGAGPLHAAELGEGLGVSDVLVPPHPGVMAALGLTVPDLHRDFSRTVLVPLRPDSEARLEETFGALEYQAHTALLDEPTEGFEAPHMERTVDARYVGQSFTLRLEYSSPLDELGRAFHRAHQERYGYAMREERVEIVNARVRAIAPRSNAPKTIPDWPLPPRMMDSRPVWFGSAVAVSDVQPLHIDVQWRPSLPVGTVIPGPALVEQYDSATVVPRGWTAHVDERFNLILRRSAR